MSIDKSPFRRRPLSADYAPIVIPTGFHGPKRRPRRDRKISNFQSENLLKGKATTLKWMVLWDYRTSDLKITLMMAGIFYFHGEIISSCTHACAFAAPVDFSY